MRIGLDISCVTPRRTGVGQMAWELTKRIIETDRHEFVLFFNSLRQPTPELSGLCGQNVKLSRHRLVGPLLLYSWKCRNKPSIESLLEEKVDAFLSFSGYIAPQDFGKRLVFVHDLEYMTGDVKEQPVLGGQYLKWVFENRLSQMDSIIVNSRGTADHLKQYMPNMRTFVVPLGVDEKFAPVTRPDKLFDVKRKYKLPEQYLLYVGNRHKRKNLSLLLKAFAHLKESDDSDLRLVMAGPETQWASQEELLLAQELIAKGLLREINYVDFDDIPAVYSCARELCLTSTLEGFGLPVLEALACGVPVACTNAIAALEYVEHSHDAITTFDANADIDIVAKAISDGMEKTAEAQKAALSVRKHNQWKTSADLLLKAIEETALVLVVAFLSTLFALAPSTLCAGAISDSVTTEIANQNYKLSYVCLPFPPGSKYFCMQGAHGRFSHNDKWNVNAVDFEMKEGSPICAVARGRVILVESSYRDGGLDPKLKSKANRVIIDHGNNVFSKYLHLAPDSVTVKPGDMVNAGQIIASSGNTGYSSAPHLHFQMQCMMGQSIPVKFTNVYGKEDATSLNENEWYTADEPASIGRPIFEDSVLPTELFENSGVILDFETTATLFGFTGEEPISISGRIGKPGHFERVVLFINSLDTKSAYLQVITSVDKSGRFVLNVSAEKLKQAQEKSSIGLLGMAVIGSDDKFLCRETVKIAL